MRNMTTTALLGVVILLVGAIKIPSPVAGGEFQASAPIAVLICAYFGFKRYFLAGILASVLGMLLGTANIFNVMIALVFRVVAGAAVVCSGKYLVLLMLCGPLGTLASRVVMAQVMGIDWRILAVAAVPGMVFTAVAVGMGYKPGLQLLKKYRII